MNRLTQKALGLGAIASLLCSCSNGNLVSFPYDPSGGRSLNSAYSDVTPRIAGRFITFASDRRGNQDVYLYDTVEQRLVEVPGLNALDMVESSPSVTEDGRYIAFVGSREGRSSLYLYDREFRQTRNLTENLRAEMRNPVISADGSTIAVEANPRGQWDILVFNRAGQPLPGVAIDPR